MKKLLKMDDLNKLEIGSLNLCCVDKKTKKSVSILNLNRGRCEPVSCFVGWSCLGIIASITSILLSLAGIAYLIYYLASG
jgi:hypothetical protein